MITRAPLPVAASLAVERSEVIAAIEMVRLGATTRIQLAGLAHAAELVVRLGPRAAAAGVVIDPVTRADGSPSGVRIRRRPTIVA